MDADGLSPESGSPPASQQQQVNASSPEQRNHGKPEDGAAGDKHEEGACKSDGEDQKGLDAKTEPVGLDSGGFHELGTAGMSEGVPSLSFTNEETKLLADKIGHAIVGKFSHSIPSPHQIQKTLANIHFVDGFKWRSINAKHILIQFRDVRDYARMLNGPNGAPVWHVDIHPMRVFKWTPDFDTFFESPIAAVWCKLIGIPIHLYEQSALLAIGKLLGKPIQADHATINQSRLTFARICVEIDISSPPPEEIILNILGKESRYKVVWDRIPEFCVECKHIGHVKESCLVLGKKKDKSNMSGSRNAQPRRPEYVPKANHREWRPKESKTTNSIPKPDRKEVEKEEEVKGNQEDNKGVDSPKQPHTPRASEVQVDDDGFQLVVKRRKGKPNIPLYQGQMGYHKTSYLDKLLKGGNVAMVSFGEADVEVIDPGGGSTVSIR